MQIIINTVATHNGPVHADDVFAVALLSHFVAPTAAVVRTRNENILATCDVLVDVGATFDPSTLRFDHHQYQAADRRRSRFLPAVPLSSAGMVLEYLVDTSHLTVEEGEGIYRELIAEIDLHDNGEGGGPLPHGGLSAIISRFNPTWDEAPDFDGAFLRAVQFAKGIVADALKSVRADLRAKAIVRGAALRNPDDNVLVMDIAVPAAREIVVELGMPHLLIVHPSLFGGWMVTTVPPSREDMFAQRLPLPEAWAGKRGAELNGILLAAGADPDVLDEGTKAVPSAVFTHGGRFCGGHGTRKAVLEMVRIALGG